MLFSFQLVPLFWSFSWAGRGPRAGMMDIGMITFEAATQPYTQVKIYEYAATPSLPTPPIFLTYE